ncbi:MAG: hypothetical protein HOI23_17425 [Deltaproteobacteria bacterium]|nr:hypothetical protein [Deltaproteobacteria bacterium]
MLLIPGACRVKQLTRRVGLPSDQEKLSNKALLARVMIVSGLLQALILLPSQALPLGDISAVGAGKREIFARLWLSAELLVGVSLMFALGLRKARWLQRLVAVCLSASFVLEVYDVFILRAFSRMPVLYNDVLLIWDGLNLALDLLPGGAFTTFVLAAGLSSLLLWVNLKALSVMSKWHQDATSPVCLRVWVIVSILFCGLIAERSPVLRDALVQSSFARLKANAVRSVEMQHAMQALASEPEAPSVKDQMAPIQLQQTPDIYILVVESYGSILFENKLLREGHQALMDNMSGSLKRLGYLTHSQASISPVVGGASWQATSTLLSGIEVKNQHLYTKLYESGAYGLPGFLGERGYTTWAVQAGYRTRPGRPVSNPWGYDHTLYFADLNYHGSRWGWGVVPDQYALGFAAERIQNEASSPNLMMFTGVSTHVPWNPGPGLQKDWHSLGEPANGTADDGGVWSKLKARLSGQPQNCISLECFQRAITYEWGVILNFIESLESQNALIVIVGDHQPPVLPTKDAAVPIHLISRGVQGLDSLTEFGFVAGLKPGSREPLYHEGLFSLLAQLLSYDPGNENAAVGIYKPRGVSPASLLRLP